MRRSSRLGRAATWPLVVLGGTALFTPCRADTVSGYVLDPVAERRLGAVEVAFLVDGGNGPTEVARRSSDGEGRFAFSGPFLAAGTAFTLVANYGGLEYPTSQLQVGEQDQVVLEVYAATDDDSDIRLDSHDLFLSLTATGVDVAHLAQVGNVGDRTYAGAVSNGERRVLAFAVPAGAIGFEGHTGQLVRTDPSRVYDSRPVPPGESQVAFTFQLDGTEFDGEYRHEVIYPTERLEVLLQPPSVALGTPFEDLGQVVFHDQTYRHYRVEHLERGRIVTIPLPLTRPLRWALKWAMLAFVPAVLIGALAAGRTGRPTASAAAGDALEARRQTLLQGLVQLDEKIGGAGPKAAARLRRKRAQNKAELVEIYRRLDHERS